MAEVRPHSHHPLEGMCGDTELTRRAYLSKDVILTSTKEVHCNVFEFIARTMNRPDTPAFSPPRSVSKTCGIS